MIEYREDLVKLPVLWSLAKISDIAYVKGGKRLPKGSQYSEIATNYPYIRVSDFKNGTVNLNDIRYICEEVHKKIAAYTISDKDIYISIAGTIGVVGLIPPVLNGANLTENAAKIVLSTRIDADYIYQVLSSYEIQKQIHNKTIATTQPKLALFRIESLLIPLPPLNEQRRIVTKIEALKARSQRVKEALEDIPQLLDQFRQSVLAAAFRGDLTADWREQNPDVEPASVLLERIRAERRRRWEEAELEKMKASGKTPKDGKWKEDYKEPEPVDISDLPKLPEGWEWVNMEAIGEVSGGLTKNSQRTDFPLKFPYLRVANVYANKLELDEIKTIGIKKEEFERVALKQGDLLVVEGNGSIDQIGRVALWDASIYPCLHQNHLIKVRFHYLKIGQYILWWLFSNNGRKQITKVASSTTGLHTLSLSKVAALPVPVAPLSEQEKIIVEIEAFFKIVENIRQQYQEAKANLDQLDQSILAKAFRGELVAQDPDDEPASVLLERIRAERDKLQTKAAKKSTPPTGGRRSKKASPQETEPVQLELGLE